MSLPTRFTAAAVLVASSATTQAQGIPVIDVANLLQTIQQVMNDITEINNQVQQITQLQSQLSSMNGKRLLGMIENDPRLRNYVPANAYTLVNAVDSSGYGGLTRTAKSLRDAGMLYNCLDLSGTARTSCQATLAQPYQHKGLLQDAMSAASGRLAQINALMGQIDATIDPKAVQEIQARIGAENALLAHEVSQVQMLQGMADSEERIARSRDRERQYESLIRSGKIADFLQ
ncbi:MAG: type IV secretion system protein [Vitreoscilla sp.]|nr:type IV secretion system protein [Vitreoscilla sp.]